MRCPIPWPKAVCKERRTNLLYMNAPTKNSTILTDSLTNSTANQSADTQDSMKPLIQQIADVVFSNTTYKTLEDKTAKVVQLVGDAVAKNPSKMGFLKKSKLGIWGDFNQFINCQTDPVANSN